MTIGLMRHIEIIVTRVMGSMMKLDLPAGMKRLKEVEAIISMISQLIILETGILEIEDIDQSLERTRRMNRKFILHHQIVVHLQAEVVQVRAGDIRRKKFTIYPYILLGGV